MGATRRSKISTATVYEFWPEVKTRRGDEQLSAASERPPLEEKRGWLAALNAGRNQFIVFTENLLENTDGVADGVGAPHQCSLGTAACCLLVMLTRATLMTSSFVRPRIVNRSLQQRDSPLHRKAGTAHHPTRHLVDLSTPSAPPSSKPPLVYADVRVISMI